jgi:hypothetical protein
MRGARALALLAVLSGCSDSVTPGSEDAAASATPSATAVAGQGFVLPPPRPFKSNPLELAAEAVNLEPGERVFAVPRRMLEHAKLGSTMVLEPARVEGREGADVVVRVRQNIPNPVHPAYVVVPRRGRVGRGTPLLVVYRDELHHAVARNVALDSVVVRITDAGRKLPDQKLAQDDVAVLSPGELVPGGQAVYHEGKVHRHAQLVSRGTARGKTQWLVLGRAGEAQLVEESRLVALPQARHNPRAGDRVWVAFRGEMVPGEVRAIDAPGLYTVKRDRAGEPLLVGPGELMAPL